MLSRQEQTGSLGTLALNSDVKPLPRWTAWDRGLTHGLGLRSRVRRFTGATSPRTVIARPESAAGDARRDALCQSLRNILVPFRATNRRHARRVTLPEQENGFLICVRDAWPVEMHSKWPRKPSGAGMKRSVVARFRKCPHSTPNRTAVTLTVPNCIRRPKQTSHPNSCPSCRRSTRRR